MKKTTILTLALASLSNGLYAETTEEMIVTATRTEEPIQDVLAASYLITSEEIARIQATSMRDVLARIPGVYVNESGGDGSNSSVFIRGTNSNHTLILVNGRRVNSATLGTTRFEVISPEQVERVEVVLGPRASLYGSDAVGGVINIITKSPLEGKNLELQVGGGNFDRQTASINFDSVFGTEKKTYLSLGADHYEMNGFDRTESRIGGNDDDDKYENTSFHLGLEQEVTAMTSFGIDYYVSEGRTEYDSYCTDASWNLINCEPYTDFRVETATVFVDLDPTDQLHLNATYTSSTDKSERGDYLGDSSTSNSFFKTTREQSVFQADYTLYGDTISIVADFYRDRVNSEITYADENGNPVSSRENLAGLIQYQGNYIDMLMLNVSARHDDNEAYGSNWTGGIAFGVDIPEGPEIIASYGKAFKAPTFNDLYYPNDPYAISNPNLDPEISRNYELNIRDTYQLFSWSVNLFRNDIENLIQWQPTDPLDPWAPWSPTNVAKVRIYGGEATIRADINDWILSASYSHSKTKDLDTEKELLRRPRNIFVFDVFKQGEKMDIGATASAYSHSFDDTDNKDQLEGYGLLDIYLTSHFTKEISLKYAITNVLNSDYTTQRSFSLGDYETEGPGLMLTLVYKPELK